MNVFSTISRFLVVTAVVCAVNVSASQYGDSANNYAQKGIKFGYNNKFTMMGALAADKACAKDAHAKKAAVETVGYMFDRTAENRLIKSEDKNVAPEDFVKHFALNYGIRKGSQKLNDMGITCKAVEKKCDVLPEGMVRDLINPVVETVVETATQPEVLTLAALYVIHNIIVPSLAGRISGSTKKN